MQIGPSMAMTALSLLQSATSGGSTQTAGSQAPAQAAVSGGRGHHRHQESGGLQDGGASADGRMQGRLQRLAMMLQKLTDQNPDAQGASYAALIVNGQGGAIAMASTPAAAGGTAGDTLVIQAQTISDVTTGSGNDQLRLQGTNVSGIYTGAGSDSLSIVGSFVSGIHMGDAGPVAVTPPVQDVADVPVLAATAPDAASTAAADTTTPLADATTADDPTVTPDATPTPTPAGADSLPAAVAGPVIDTSGPGAISPAAAPVVAGNNALSIAAYLINDIATGSGNDALALTGRVVSNVDAGAGNDAIAIQAKVVSGISGGDGNDAIAVDAGVGVAGVSNAAAWFAMATTPVVAANGAATASVGAAAKAYADVEGGAGNDVISVRTGSVLAVAGGTGNDTINAQGGAISLVYGAGDGNDTVNVAAGAQVVLQLAPDAGAYSVEFGQDSMTVKMGDGSVTFKGIGAGTVGIKQGDGGMALITQPGANAGLNLAV